MKTNEIESKLILRVNRLLTLGNYFKWKLPS